MRKFLSIVIPRYKESEKTVFPLLSSINNQVGIDFDDVEVIFANDGDGAGPLDEDFFNLFDMEIRQIEMKENKGPGVARQVGLDNAIGDYVMFCDADDRLHSVGVLGALMQECEKQAPDMLTSEWIEEIKNPDGKFAYVTHDIDNTWMFGKVFRRAFLQSNNIRFHDKLRVHEDSYFLCICAAVAQRNLHVAVTTYLWCFQPNSITRRNDGIYSFESIPTFIEACSMAHKEVEKINPDLMEGKIIQFVLYQYFSLHRPEWLETDKKKYLDAAEKALVKYIKPLWHYWENAKPETITEAYNQERQRTFAGAVETELLNDWLKRIGLIKEVEDSK